MERKDRASLKERFRRFWQGLGVLLGGLLLVDFLVCLIAGLLAVGWLLNQLGVAVFTAVLLLLGIIVFLPAKRLGVGTVSRRLLAGGLAGGAVVLLFYIAAYTLLFLYVL